MVMAYYYGSSNLGSNEIIVFLICFALLIAYRKARAYQASKVIVQSSLIILLHVPGTGLTKVSEGTLGGYPYKMMIAASSGGKNTSPILVNEAKLGGSVILALTLPFVNTVHLACLGIPGSIDVLAEARGVGLQPAVLEGDFPDYFRMYCGTDQQIDLRTVIDPADMAFLVDYCKRENWEILGDTIYFSQNRNAPDDDPDIDNTTMVKDAEDFAKRVVPALKRMTT